MQTQMTTDPFLIHLHALLQYSHANRAVLKLRDQKQMDFEELSEYLSQVTAERDRLAAVAMVVSFLLAAVPLVVMASTVLARGVGVVAHADWWTEPIPGDVSRSDLADSEGLRELDEFEARVRAVTPEAVRAFAAEHFDPGRRAEGVVRGAGDA